MNRRIIATASIGFALLSAQATAIADTAATAGNFKTLVSPLQAVGLVDTLQGKGPVAVPALKDAASSETPKTELDTLLQYKARLKSEPTDDEVSGKLMSTAAEPGRLKSVQGVQLTIDTKGGVRVNNAKVVAADAATSNGLIHAIDTVLMPK